MDKYIFFFEYDPKTENMIYSWDEVINAINNDQQYIYTTQMGILSVDLIYKKCYHVNIVDKDYHDAYEIKYKKPSKSYDIFKMWKDKKFKK